MSALQHVILSKSIGADISKVEVKDAVKAACNIRKNAEAKFQIETTIYRQRSPQESRHAYGLPCIFRTSCALCAIALGEDPMASDKLTKFKAKGDFEITKEPHGATEMKPSNRLRFIIQKHDASRLHYDLRLELDGVFKSWAVTKGPSLNPGGKRLAVERGPSKAYVRTSLLPRLRLRSLPSLRRRLFPIPS
jgi:hypothetical protein